MNRGPAQSGSRETARSVLVGFISVRGLKQNLDSAGAA